MTDETSDDLKMVFHLRGFERQFYSGRTWSYQVSPGEQRLIGICGDWLIGHATDTAHMVT